jgi:mRNA-degrading endonuclease RelE of RelBE toxin-antitoxin system
MFHLNLKISKSASRFLDTIPLKHFSKLLKCFLQVAKTPPKRSSRLKGYKYRQFDVGCYRIIYDVLENTPRIIFIGYRDIG